MNDNNAPHYTELPIAQLEENKGQIAGLPANPRNIQPDKLAKLKRSILDNPEMLQLRGILVYPHGDKYIVIGGNMRLRAMVELGMTSAPCVVIPSHVTADKLRAYTILDNSSMGEWDWQALQLEWDTAQLDDWGIDLPDFTDEEDEDAIASEDDYEMPEEIEEVETDIQLGDLIILEGRGLTHRLMCGDSTRSDHFATLMGGGSADLIVTDPPYNVDYTEKLRAVRTCDGGKAPRHKDITNDKMSNSDFLDFLTKAFTNMAGALKAGGAFYVWYAGLYAKYFIEAVERAELDFKQPLVWVKSNHVMGFSNYQPKHEPCLYGWKAGASHYFIAERDHATVLERAKSLLSGKATQTERRACIKELTTALSEGTDVLRYDKPLASKLHPTMKPIPLFGELIRNSSRKGESVLDPFAGSGTTLVACHDMGRNAYAMEYSPNYCQVIINRLKELDPDLKVTNERQR